MEVTYDAKKKKKQFFNKGCPLKGINLRVKRISVGFGIVFVFQVV